MEKEKTDRIGEVINLIKANSKDAHFAQTLIDELMTLRKEDVLNGQSLMDIKMSDIVKRHDGDMWGMFYKSKFNQDISNWKINKDCVRFNMFDYCTIKEEYKPKAIR